MRVMSRRLRLLPLVAVVAGLLAVLPASVLGNPGPLEPDGSTYTWGGAARLIVGVDQWGGGFVRSHPYLIDCPHACVRSVDQGTHLTLTAYPSAGFEFTGWDGACHGQGNPCDLVISGEVVDVTALFEGPPGSPAPPAAPQTQHPHEHCDEHGSIFHHEHCHDGAPPDAPGDEPVEDEPVED